MRKEFLCPLVEDINFWIDVLVIEELLNLQLMEFCCV